MSTHVPKNPVRLHANDLYSKWGFGDGDLLSDICYDLGIHDVDDRELLVRLVQKYLGPLLPEDVTLECISTHHNPIRASDWTDKIAPPWASEVFVDVTGEQVLACAEEIRADPMAQETAR